MKIKNMLLTGFATAATLGTMAPVASADAGQDAGAGAVDAALESLDLSAVQEPADLTTWGVGESAQILSDVASLADGVNETGELVLNSPS
ncbi:hypothetical protein [Streptomyces sp. NPDC091371]|uniref:hypothetical protein n=1 Tax=Streptomyces sp. NPDC091371 TaxID=3155303 RepID=UPI003443A01C